MQSLIIIQKPFISTKLKYYSTWRLCTNLFHLTQTINSYNYLIAMYKLSQMPPWILRNPTIRWNLLIGNNGNDNKAALAVIFPF